MKGLIAAAGLSTRLQDLCQHRNKCVLDLGGETILGNILNHFEAVGITDNFVTVGFDAAMVRNLFQSRIYRPTWILNPFYEHYGILGSMWVARPHLDGTPFLFTVGDHYFALPRLQTFQTDQPEADVLVDVELKSCDDEDMKVYLNKTGQLLTMTKTVQKGKVLGEFTGTVRFSAEGSRQFFETLDRHVWEHGIQGYVADVLCAYHRKWELAFHLSNDHHRVEVDFPYDLEKARALYEEVRKA